MGFSSSSPQPNSATTQNWLWVFRTGIGLILLASLLFLLGFFTKMWYDDGTVHYGLWRVCTGAACEDVEADDIAAYRIATQAFQCMAFVAYGLAPILHYLFYCTKQKKGFGIRTRVFDITYGCGVAFHLASVLIYGLEQPSPKNFDWSYEMTAASVAINAVGLSIAAFARNNALHDFRFCSHHTGGKSKRSRRISDLNSRHTGRSGGGIRRKRSHQQQLAFGNTGPASGNNKHQLHHQQQQGDLPAPSVSVVVNNNFGLDPSKQAMGGASYNPYPLQPHPPPPPPPRPYPALFNTNASGQHTYPPPVSSTTDGQTTQFPPQSDYQTFPATSSANIASPLQPSAPTGWPTGAEYSYPQREPADQQLPPLRGNYASHAEAVAASEAASGQKNPPSYEDVLIQTGDNGYQ